MAKATKHENTAAESGAFDAMSAFFTMPGFEASGILGEGKKAMELSNDISKIYVDATKEVIAKQVDLAKDNMKELMEAAQGVSAPKIAEPDMSGVVEFWQGMLQRNMAAAKDIGEVIVKSNQDVVSKLQSQYEEGMKAWQSAGK